MCSMTDYSYDPPGQISVMKDVSKLIKIGERKRKEAVLALLAWCGVGVSVE